MVKLVKLTQIWRPLYVEYKAMQYELGNILVYDENGIFAQTGNGWFEGLHLNVGEAFTIDTAKPLARRKKVNFGNGEPFIVKNEGVLEGKHDLYIPKSDLEFDEPVYSKTYDTISKCIALKNDPRVTFTFRVKDILSDAFDSVVPHYRVTCFAREELPKASVASDAEFEAAIAELRRLREAWKAQEEYLKNYSTVDFLAEISGNEDNKTRPMYVRD